jgi:DNA-binding CsgD family transcriptional regulator
MKSSQPIRVSLADLTLKQRKVLALLWKGKVCKEIAAEMGIGLSSVRQYKDRLCKKFAVKNTYQLIAVSAFALLGADAEIGME